MFVEKIMMVEEGGWGGSKKLWASNKVVWIIDFEL